MWKGALVGAFALVAIGSSSVLADTSGTLAGQQVSSTSGFVFTQAHIARFKAVLKLTPAQEQHWPAVDKAFREMVSERLQESAAQGLVQGISNRAVSLGSNVMALRRLAAAAYPLIRSLDEEQKQSALALARTMGLEKIALAF